MAPTRGSGFPPEPGVSLPAAAPPAPPPPAAADLLREPGPATLDTEPARPGPSASAPTAPDLLPDVAARGIGPPPERTTSEAEPPGPGTTQAAAIPATALPDPAQVLFDPGSDVISDIARALLAGIADELLQDDSIRVELVAYAQVSANTTLQPRRLSLSRAHAVRSFLEQRGVASPRIMVRARGDDPGQGAPDRVDILPRR